MTEQLNEAYSALLEKLTGWVDTLILNLPNLGLAILVILVSFLIARRVKKVLKKVLANRFTQSSVKSLIGNSVYISIIILGFFLALGALNLDKALTSVLAGAGVAGLAIGLALQGTLSNTFSGIFLAVKDIMNVGDWIVSNGYSGAVEEINLRYIKLREPDNNIVVIPNKMVLENPFKNYGLTTQIRTWIKCGVSYDADLDKVRQLTIQSINEIFPEREGKEIEFYYQEFGDSSINFMVRFWVDAEASINVLESKSLAILAIKKKFDSEGIDIPFPIRTLVFENKLKLPSQLQNMEN